jgi:hypothetical protein
MHVAHPIGGVHLTKVSLLTQVATSAQPNPRGCTTPEQAVVGGCAHLLNFEGTDTMSAAYYAQVHTNVPVI